MRPAALSSLACALALLPLLASAAAPPAALSAGTASGQVSRALVLRNAAGATLFSRPMREGEVFGIRFLHSVAKSPVEEWFRLEGDSIFLERTEYQDFGAGLPHSPGPGQTMSQLGGWLVISGYHRRLPAFDVRVGRIAGHLLLLPEKGGRWTALPLSMLAPPGTAVTFTTAVGRQ